MLSKIYKTEYKSEERKEVHKEIKRQLVLFRKEHPESSEENLNKRIDLMKRIIEAVEEKEFDVNKRDPRDIITTNNKLRGINAGIINTDTGVSCVNRHNGKCSLCNICFSLNHERRLYYVLMHHLKQAVYFHERSTEDMIMDICYSGFDYIRWDEAGDLECESQVEKMNEVMKGVKERRPDIGFQIYTKSYDLGDKLKGVSKVDSMCDRSEKSYRSFPRPLYDKKNHRFKRNEIHYYLGMDMCLGECEKCKGCFTEGKTSHKWGCHH